MDNESLGPHDSTAGNIIYKWWCPRCQVDHYTPCCPIEEYKRLAHLWKDLKYEFCPHCGQLMSQGGWI